jgi:hypothetical protein
VADAATTSTAATAGGRRRRRFVAVMCGSSSRGRWLAAARITGVAFWGGVDIDLRRAEIDRPVVDIFAWAVMGGVTVTVPEGVRVELDGMVVMGGSTDLTRSTVPQQASPLVRVHARGLWGLVAVRSRKTREQRAAAAAATSDGDTAARPTDPGPAAFLELPAHILDDVVTRLPSVPGPCEPPWARRGRRDDRRTGARHEPQRAEVPHDATGPLPTSIPTSPAAGGTKASTSRPSPPSAPTPAPRAQAPSGTLTMMVTDIVDSTALAERLGDRRWIEVLADHNALVREAVARHGGTEVKAQGDGFLMVFSSARRAIMAAVEVQRSVGGCRARHPDTPWPCASACTPARSSTSTATCWARTSWWPCASPTRRRRARSWCRGSRAISRCRAAIWRSVRPTR